VGHLQFVAGTVNLVVDAVVNSLTWTGAANNQWDTSSINWQDAALTALTYTNQYGTNLLGDIVTFDDTGAAQPNVILSAVLRPARINWSAGATDYSFTGSGGISGTGQAVKTGNSTVTLTTSNDYSGGTLINAGTVAVTHPNSLGSGSVRLHSALRFTNSASFNFSNTLYNDPGADMVYDVASGTVVNLTGNLTLTGGGSVNRAVITKQGAGTLKFAGTSVIDSSSSRLLINVGEVSVTTPMSFGGHGQCVTVGSLDNTAKLIVDATTLGVVGNYELRLGDGGGSGTLVITNGGTFSGNQLTIAQGNTTSGFNATGQVYQASGAVTLSGAVVLGANNAYTVIPVTPSSALYQLNGGTLTTTGIQRKDTNVLAIARFNGGTLKAAGSGTLISPFGTAEIQSGGLTLDTDGNSPAITQVLSGGGALIKTGSGTLNLNTNNTYTGVTTVSAGALGGSGSIAGNLVVSSGSFEPGVAGIGTFTVGGSAWITNQALFQLNKTQSPSNDLAVITGALTAGGTLTVTNLGAGAAGALTNGDFFKLFSKPVSGSFSTLALPTLAPDLAWKNDLGVDGSISVIAALTTPNPTNIVVTNIGGGQLVLNWPAGEGWQLQAQTNSGSIGLSTNWVNVTGATPPFTNSIDLTNGAVFYRLKY
jgi:autotransporter-associated beta strand protein